MITGEICADCTIWFQILLEEIMSFSDLMLFALSSNQELAQRVSREMGLPLGKSTVRQFSDGEIQVNIEESIRGKDVYILQSSNLKHISYQLRSDWFTSSSFPVLTSITVIWHHHINGLCTSPFQRIYHNQNFHQIIVNR